jgi:hypothetical protein
MGVIEDGKMALDAIKLSFGLYREAMGLARDVESSLPEGEKKRAIEESLARADVSSKIAEAQIAQSLGYNLCQCTFPPQIMLSVGVMHDGAYGMAMEHFKCPNCNKEYP